MGQGRIAILARVQPTDGKLLFIFYFICEAFSTRLLQHLDIRGMFFSDGGRQKDYSWIPRLEDPKEPTHDRKGKLKKAKDSDQKAFPQL